MGLVLLAEQALSGELTWLVLASSLNMSRASAAANAKIRFLCTVVRSLLGTLREDRERSQMQPKERGHMFLLAEKATSVWTFLTQLPRIK